VEKERRLEAAERPAARRRGSGMALSWMMDWSGGEWQENGAGFLQPSHRPRHDGVYVHVIDADLTPLEGEGHDLAGRASMAAHLLTPLVKA
jgi:hypothetical protein